MEKTVCCGALLVVFVFHQVFFSSTAQVIGVNYGALADNLPATSATATLLASTSITKLRLYDTNPDMMNAMAGSSVGLLVGVANADIPTLASSAAAASTWAASHIVPYLPASPISSISVGNELLTNADPSLSPLLIAAMQNLKSALQSTAFAANIKISTVHSMAVLSQSDPPSSGALHPDLDPFLDPILAFLRSNGSPFMINPYPWFAYRSDPRPETLAFCLFQPNAGRVDSGSGITYMNMFDAQVDAVRAALDRKGYNDVDIVIAETGWPYKGDADEVGATVDNAKAYNGGLVAHLRSLAGTPRVPGKSVETYIFALYDEDLKSGPESERSFGLYRADMTPNYDAGLGKKGESAPPLQPQTPPQPQASPGNVKGETPTGWCFTTGTVPGTSTGRVPPAQEMMSQCYFPSKAGLVAKLPLPSILISLGIILFHWGFLDVCWNFTP